MDREELINTVIEKVSEEFEVDEGVVTPEADVRETLELDSLSLVDLVALIESTFGVKVKGEDLKNLRTFGALYDFLEPRVK